jgi:hypothetical protein
MTIPVAAQLTTTHCLKMETAQTSETLLTYHLVQHHDPEDRDLKCTVSFESYNGHVAQYVQKTLTKSTDGMLKTFKTMHCIVYC